VEKSVRWLHSAHTLPVASPGRDTVRHPEVLQSRVLTFQNTTCVTTKVRSTQRQWITRSLLRRRSHVS
jgi:hypothetical protein